MRGDRRGDLWRAVLKRDSSCDGRFVYGVRTTGIYCRPSCPSKRPHAAQVRFFSKPDEAETAGFRACRRCQPKDAVSPQIQWLERTVRHIQSGEGLTSLRHLAAQVGKSPQHLQRMFRRMTGVTPREYASALRLGNFKTQVKEGRGVTEALYEAGYGSSRGLYEGSRARLGMTPGTYRRGGRGMRMDYTIMDCSLGRLLVAATAHGVSAINLGSSDARLEAALREEYPAAEIRRDDKRLKGPVAALLRHLRGQEPDLRLPLDVRATAFQCRVWEQLRAIPYGQTRSYGEVARRLRRPHAARAVARACATNPAALVIPCHRVVAADGRLGGYRWGAGRKRALIAAERAASATARTAHEARRPSLGSQGQR